MIQGLDSVKRQQSKSEFDQARYAAQSMLFSRTVDNFQSYLVDLLTHVFSEYPHSIYRKKIDVSKVFEVGNIDSLKHYLVERGVGINLQQSYRSK